jgi:D-alanyl-D-alanine carboxypeptidase/D-alanyl-D-alanine-endopeptidase (penicillin-binding protein 4)
MLPPTHASRSTSLLLVLLVAVAGTGRAQTLAQRLDRRLDAPGFEHLFWGVSVADGQGHTLYGRNAHRLFIPASNTKLVVTIVANALLGPDFTVHTSVYATGPVDQGILQGDLVLYGRGDPTFSVHCYRADTSQASACDSSAFTHLDQLAAQLRARGVRTVAGDLVGDGSYFSGPLIHPDWQNYDLAWWYAAPVSGLGFNDNSVDVRELAADSAGHPPQVILAPDVGTWTFDNRAETGLHGSPRTFDLFRTADGSGYYATGSLPLGMAPRSESAAVSDPDRFAAAAFRQALARAGITVRGVTRSTTDSFSYAAARTSAPLADIRSRPLRDWLNPILLHSQNWFAEMLIKQVGRQRGAAGSWDEGRRVERRFLIDSVRIDSTEFSLQDGSGLAANNYLSPSAFTMLLAWARHDPHFDAIHDALPESGKPGSLSNRFIGTPAAGAVHAKTGSISGVNTISGYLERPDGQVRIFSVMANHHTLSTSRILAQLDSIVVELARP